jgi:nicotinamide riboside kinase
LLTNNDLPWQADNQRQNKFNRELIFKLNEDEIKKTGLPYFIVKGFDDNRLNEAIKIVQSI